MIPNIFIIDMEIEYSNEVRGLAYAYRLEGWEKLLISKSLIPEIKKLQKRIERLENNPRNEGQATYSVKIDELRREMNCVQQIIDTFLQ